jgi:hypothetical protein
MANTPNLALYKPSRNDSVEVDVSLAQNFDIIDTEVNGVKGRLTTVETNMTALSTAQTAATQNAQTALDTVDGANSRLTVVEADVAELKVNGGGGGGSPTFIDGGSFLDTYASQTTGLDGGEF